MQDNKLQEEVPKDSRGFRKGKRDKERERERERKRKRVREKGKW